MDSESKQAMARTGVPGLDDVLSGGLSRGHVFLLEGNPGTGKTTVAIRFLLEGAERGEAGLYITLSETERELRAGAASHGLTIDRSIEIFELVPPEALLDGARSSSSMRNSAFCSIARRRSASMPRMNGAELAVAARPLRPGLPILLATGYAELPPGEQIELPRLGKSYSQEQLETEIRKLLAS